MQSEQGKLFIGGISWDTNEERLREYFSRYGEILEAVIMKDRHTGRARGFGFVVFADPQAADRVTKQKHTIDGRMVEAKRAVPRDDQNSISRSSGSIQGSPGPGRTRKIFVGGLPSTVTENEFRMYFEQFGAITDVVVMYDQNTQRPRGFGFITYDSEDSVDQVLLKTFHELSGKMVEVKRAVPKELSPSPSRSPLGGYSYGGLNKMNSLFNGYSQGYSPSIVGPYGLRGDARFSPTTDGRSGFATIGTGYGSGLNFEPEMISGFGGSANFNRNPTYGQGLNPQFTGNNSNRFGNAVGYDGGIGGSTSFFSSGNQNLLGNNAGFDYGTNSVNMNGYAGSGSGRISGSFANAGTNWGSSPFSSEGGGSISNRGGNIWYGVNDINSHGLGGREYARNTASSLPSLSSFAASNGGYEETFAGFYGGSSVNEDPAWRSGSEREGSGSFGFALGNELNDAPTRSSPGYVGAYNVSNRQINRGIVG